MSVGAPKIAMFCFGTHMRYRFDLLLKSCPSITKAYIVIFTTQYYYDLYKDYHDHFEFVAIDDLRKDDVVSLNNEVCLEVPTDQEYFLRHRKFYNIVERQYPFFLQRYVFKHFANRNILNFVVCDTDMVIRNNHNCIADFFDNIPSGTVYGWEQGKFEKSSELAGLVSNFLNNAVMPLFPTLDFDSSKLQFRNDDGFIYGGHFRSSDDLMLAYNLMNTMIIQAFIKNETSLFGSTYYHNFTWVYPATYDLLSINLNYQYKAAQDFTYLKNYGLAMIHKTRPEDTFYSCGYREVWAHFSFDYSDVTSISKFIQNNKQQLRNYYAQHLPVEDITDTHVYTYLGS